MHASEMQTTLNASIHCESVRSALLMRWQLTVEPTATVILRLTGLESVHHTGPKLDSPRLQAGSAYDPLVGHYF